MRTAGTPCAGIGARGGAALAFLCAASCADARPRRADAGPEPDVYRPLDCTGVQLRVAGRVVGTPHFEYAVSGEPVQIRPKTSEYFDPRMLVDLGHPSFFGIRVYRESLAPGRLPADEFSVVLCDTPAPCGDKEVHSCTHPKDWEEDREGPLPLGSWLEFSEASKERVAGEFWLEVVCEFKGSRIGRNASGCFDLVASP